jgi:hypothetical protein
MITKKSQERFQRNNKMEQGRSNSFNSFTTKARHTGLYAAKMTKKKRRVHAYPMLR